MSNRESGRKYKVIEAFIFGRTADVVYEGGKAGAMKKVEEVLTRIAEEEEKSWGEECDEIEWGASEEGASFACTTRLDDGRVEEGWRIYYFDCESGDEECDGWIGYLEEKFGISRLVKEVVRIYRLESFYFRWVTRPSVYLSYHRLEPQADWFLVVGVE